MYDIATAYIVSAVCRFRGFDHGETVKSETV